MQDAPEPEFAIEFDDVSFSYGSGEAPGTRALDHVDLAIAPGEFVAVVGANGSGKSTLAKHVNALLVPAEGTVRTTGFDTRDASHLIDVRRRAGMVFQNPDNQSVASIVREDVAFGPENLGLSTEEVRARVSGALAQVGMADHAEDEVHALSGGQKQLVAIAGVLAMEPEILVLDEPGAMLDVRGRTEVMRIVRELHGRGLTVVLVTHFMEDALEADWVVALDAGKVALEGTPAEVFSDAERLRALHLAPPFSVGLAAALRSRGVAVSADAGLDEAELREELLRLAASVGTGARVGSDSALRMPVRPEEPARPAQPAQCGRPPHHPVVFDHVSYSYDTRAAGNASDADAAFALRDVDLALQEGEILGIVGHTGSGKSTLTQLMNALLVPTSGRVMVGELDTAEKKTRRAVRSRVGLVFQYPETQLFATTVAEDVAFGPRNLKLGKQEVSRRCREALGRVGLDPDEFSERSPFALSGGQQRRVAIAGVLAMEPQVLVLDEPAAGLDPRGIAEMRELLRKLNSEGTTIALVSHSMEEVAELCDRVLVLGRGSCLALGAPAEVFAPANEPQLRKAGLGLPRATRFAIELSRGGLDLLGPILTGEQLVAGLCDRLGKKA